MKNQVQFHHARNNGAFDITLAFQIDEENNQVRFGYSFCSPRDQFNRAKGRLISEGRLNKRPVVIALSDVQQTGDDHLDTAVMHKGIEIGNRMISQMISTRSTLNTVAHRNTENHPVEEKSI